MDHDESTVSSVQIQYSTPIPKVLQVTNILRSFIDTSTVVLIILRSGIGVLETTINVNG